MYQSAITVLSEIDGIWGKGQLSDAHKDLANWHEINGRLDEAIASSGRGLEAGRQLVRESSNQLHYRAATADFQRNQGTLYRANGDPENALVAFREAIALLQEAFERNRLSDGTSKQVQYARRLWSDFHRDLGGLLHELGRYEEARDVFRKSLRSATMIIRYQPSTRIFSNLPGLRSRFVSTLVKAAEVTDIEDFFQEQLSTWNDLQGICDDRAGCQLQLLDVRHQYGHWLENAGRRDEADEQFRDAMETFAAIPKDDRTVEFALRCPNFDMQAPLVSAVLPLARDAVRNEPSNRSAWMKWNNFVIAHYRANNWEGAAEEAALATELANDDPNLLLYVTPVGWLAGGQDEYRLLCLRLLDHAEGTTPDAGWRSVVRMCGLDPDSCGAPERVLRLAQQLPLDGSLGFDDVTLFALGRAHYRAGNYQEAVSSLQEALEKASANREPLICLDLALAYHYWGRNKEARKWLNQAIERLNALDEAHNESGARWHRTGQSGVQIEVLLQEAEQVIPAKQQL